MENHRLRSKILIVLLAFFISILVSTLYLFIGKSTISRNWSTIKTVFIESNENMNQNEINYIVSSLDWLGIKLEYDNSDNLKILQSSYIYAFLLFLVCFIAITSFFLHIFKRYISRQFARIEGLQRIVSLFELRDSHSTDHSRNVAIIAKALGESYKLGTKRIYHLYLAGLVHDIGKLSVPVDILNKEGKLMPDEWKVIREHTQVSQEILSYFKELKEVQKLVGYHHEKVDGSGYPHGLKKKHIPLGGRILAVADVFEALTGERPYREPMHYSESFDIMRSMNLDNEVLDRLIDIWPTIQDNIIFEGDYCNEKNSSDIGLLDA